MIVAVDLFFKLVQSTALDENATKRVEVKLMLALRREKIPYTHDLQFMLSNPLSSEYRQRRITRRRVQVKKIDVRRDRVVILWIMTWQEIERHDLYSR